MDLLLRPLLKDAMYGRRQTLEEFLPRSVDAWNVLCEIEKAHDSK